MRRDTQGPATRWDYAILGILIVLALWIGLAIGWFL